MNLKKAKQNNDIMRLSLVSSLNITVFTQKFEPFPVIKFSFFTQIDSVILNTLEILKTERRILSNSWEATDPSNFSQKLEDTSLKFPPTISENHDTNRSHTSNTRASIRLRISSR